MRGITVSRWLVGGVTAGLVAVFFYAAARPRFGPGVRTAVIVGFALYCGSYLLVLIGYHMIGLYPDDLLLIWAVQGLVETILATLAGAWLYRERTAQSEGSGNWAGR